MANEAMAGLEKRTDFARSGFLLSPLTVKSRRPQIVAQGTYPAHCSLATSLAMAVVEGFQHATSKTMKTVFFFQGHLQE